MRALFERHHAALHAFVAGRSRDAFEASDVVQDAMLEVWRRAGDFESRSSVKTWMFAIARNKLIDRTRKGARTVLTDEPPETVDEGPSAEELVARADDAVVLRGCMDKLSEAHRSVIHLAYFEDLAYRDIAEVEGVPTGTVKTRVHHAKKLLLACVEAARGAVSGAA